MDNFQNEININAKELKLLMLTLNTLQDTPNEKLKLSFIIKINLSDSITS